MNKILLTPQLHKLWGIRDAQQQLILYSDSDKGNLKAQWKWKWNW